MVALSDNTNQKDLTVQSGVTYTVSIQTLSSTELPSGVVEVPYQDRTSQLLAIQLLYSLSLTRQPNPLPMLGKDREVVDFSSISH